MISILLTQAFTLSYSEFLNSTEWNGEKAEILTYEVKKSYLGKELIFKANFVTEGLHYMTGTGKVGREDKKGTQPVINFSMNYRFTRDHFPKSIQADLLFLKKPMAPLIYQNVSIQDWDNPQVRKFSAKNGKPYLEYESRSDLKQDRVFEKSPLFTVEQLFFYLRTIPQKMGHREKIWLLGSLCEDGVPSQPEFAEINVRTKRVLSEKPTRYITVHKENGKKFEFYLSEHGLHQVQFAKFPDGTTWNLTGIKFKRYWFF